MADNVQSQLLAGSNPKNVLTMSKTGRLPFCNSCRSSDSKYRCPRCDAVSCSLACVKKHKVLNSCSGQRDKTKYITKSEYNKQNLLSDYRFLEEANRVADNAQRDHKKKKKFFSSNVKKLRVEANKKGINLRLMPVGFQKRKENTSFFHFKSKVIMWRIKWEFPQANTHYVEAKQSENKPIKTLLEKYLHPTHADPVLKQRLKVYRGGEIGVFFRNHSTQRRSFFKIDTLLTVKEALKGRVVIEYPTFHVVLSRNFSEYLTDISSPMIKRVRLKGQDDSSTSGSDESSGSCSENFEIVKKCGEEKTNDTMEQKVVETNDHGKNEGVE